ncbi:MAG: hypothetical protein ACRDOY_12490 [Nocardioidaceae bacterium]
MTRPQPIPTAAMARATPRTSRVSGPGRERGDRDDDRGFDLAAERDVDDLDRRAWLPDDRDRELRELRDLGGEDVRVAMMRGYAMTPPVTRVTRRVSTEPLER